MAAANFLASAGESTPFLSLMVLRQSGAPFLSVMRRVRRFFLSRLPKTTTSPPILPTTGAILAGFCRLAPVTYWLLARATTLFQLRNSTEPVLPRALMMAERTRVACFFLALALEAALKGVTARVGVFWASAERPGIRRQRVARSANRSDRDIRRGVLMGKSPLWAFRGVVSAMR